MGNWMSARLQGEIAGKNMAGERVPFEQVSFHSSHGFGNTIGWTGDVRPLPDRTNIHYPTPEPHTYCRIILREGRVIGGTTVNRPDLMGVMTNLIKKRTDLTNSTDALRAGSVDLKALLA
jgi:NAD(P)H-nitrite reductase large subunit